MHDNAATFFHAPDVYRRYGVVGYHDGRMKRRVNGGGYLAVPFSLALRASMAFPIVVPACVLETSVDPDRPYLHLRDGGMADNIGANPGWRILRQDKAQRKLMIVIDGVHRPRDPCCKVRRKERPLPLAWKAATLPLDSWLHYYRENLVTGEIIRDGQGRILGGTTADGIRVVFLYPELPPESMHKPFEEIGVDLKMKDGAQGFLFRAAQNVVEAQGPAIAWGMGDGAADASAVALKAPNVEVGVVDATERKARHGILAGRAFDRPLKFLRLKKR